MIHTLTAAQAAEEYGNGTLPANAFVEDTAANIVEFLDTLEQIALAGKLRAIELSGGTVLNLDMAQVHNDSDALLKIRRGYELAIQDTAANVLAGLSDLEQFALHGHLQSITLTGSGHPTLSVTSAQVRHDLAVLLKISGAANVIVTDGHAAIAANLDVLQKLAGSGELASINITDSGAMAVSAAQVRLDAKALSAISGPYQLVVKDSSADVATYLLYLESAAKAGHLQKILLTDSNPISLTSKQFFSDGDAIAKISGTYSLTVTGVSAANATTVAANGHVTELFVSDTAAHIQQNLSQLETLTTGGARVEFGGFHPASDVLAGITLTDGGTPTLSLSESDLSGAEGVLGLITSSFVLNVTGVLASDVLALSNNGLIAELSVVDSASSIAAHMSDLEQVAYVAAKLGTVTVTDGTYTSSDLSNDAMGVYAHFTSALMLEITPTNGSNFKVDLFGQLLDDGPASVGITVPVGITVLPNSQFVEDYLLQLQSAADHGYLASLTLPEFLRVEDMNTSEMLQLDNPTILQAMFSTGEFSAYTETSISVAQALSYYSSALSTAVEGGINARVEYLNGVTVAVNDAAMIAGIIDSAANLQANLDSLTTALGGRAFTLPIQLTDTLPPTIAVSVAQATNDAAVLNAITSSYLLSINGSASALDSIDLSGLTNEKIELGFTNLNRDVTVEGGNIVDLNLAHLLVANDVISVEAYASGGQTGTEIDLTGTDGLAHKIILIGVDPSSLVVYTPFDTGTALGGHGPQVTGGVSVATALGGSGLVAITDTLANVQAHLDALEAIHARITGIGFSNSGTPTLTLSEVQVTSDNDVLQLLSGNYHIALTGVAALDAANLAGRTDVFSVAVADSTADVIANLDALEHVAKAGKLSTITLTDSGTPAISLTEAQLFTDQDALSAIGSSFTLNVTGVLASDVLALSNNGLIAELGVVDSASSIAAHMSDLEQVAYVAAKLGTVTVTDGTYTSSDLSNDAMGVYAHFTSALMLEITPTNGSNFKVDLFGQLLDDGPASVGITVPVGITVLPNSQFVEDYLLQLQSAADHGYLASLTLPEFLRVEDMNTSEMLQLDNPTILQAMFSTGEFSAYTETSISVAQALSYYSSALSTAVEGGINARVEYLNGVTVAVNDAAMIAGIIDSAANLQANLDSLTTALGGRAFTLPIQLTDTLPPTIAVSVAQATNDAAVLGNISSTYLLSISGTAEQLDGLTLSPAANEKVELALTSLDHDITITSAVFDVDLAKLAVANDAVTVQAYSSGGQTGTEIDLTGTDGMTHKIIILGEDPNSLEAYAPIDSGMAAGGHGVPITGGLTVAQALAGSGPEAISDTAANVAANLDALESIVGQITGIGFTDSGTPALSLTEAQFSADHDVLSLLSGNYTLNVTNVAAADALAIAAYTDVNGIFVADTGTDLTAELDQLEHIFKAGKLEGVTLTSGTLGTLTETQLLADSDVLKLLGNSDVFFH